MCDSVCLPSSCSGSIAFHSVCKLWCGGVVSADSFHSSKSDTLMVSPARVCCVFAHLCTSKSVWLRLYVFKVRIHLPKVKLCPFNCSYATNPQNPQTELLLFFFAKFNLHTRVHLPAAPASTLGRFPLPFGPGSFLPVEASLSRVFFVVVFFVTVFRRLPGLLRRA